MGVDPLLVDTVVTAIGAAPGQSDRYVLWYSKIPSLRVFHSSKSKKKDKRIRIRTRGIIMCA